MVLEHGQFFNLYILTFKYQQKIPFELLYAKVEKKRWCANPYTMILTDFH